MAKSNDLLRLGKCLRALRGSLGISQEEAADRAGVHRTYIGGVERGERNPSFATLSRMIHGLGSDWREFAKLLSSENKLKASR